jgi:sugar-specific transcriptional regulator TrmB
LTNSTKGLIVYTEGVTKLTQKEIVQTLEKLGLSSYEAKAYLAILSEPPLTGYKLSKVSGVPRSRIYETIEKLAAKGLVLTQAGETSLVKPVSFESFLDRVDNENRQNMDLLRKALSQIKKPAEDEGIWSISGRDQVIEATNQLISQSKKHIYIEGFGSDFLLFKDALSKAEERKVPIFGVYCGDVKIDIGNLSPHPGEVCSSCQDIALSVDSEQALVGYTYPADHARVALSKNPGLIYIIEQYVKHEVFISRIFNMVDKEISDKLNKAYKQMINKLP